MTDTREEYEEWCIETMPRQVAQWEIEHGHNSWQAWQEQQDKINRIKLALFNLLADYKDEAEGWSDPEVVELAERLIKEAEKALEE